MNCTTGPVAQSAEKTEDELPDPSVGRKFDHGGRSDLNAFEVEDHAGRGVERKNARLGGQRRGHRQLVPLEGNLVHEPVDVEARADLAPRRHPAELVDGLSQGNELLAGAWPKAHHGPALTGGDLHRRPILRVAPAVGSQRIEWHPALVADLPGALMRRPNVREVDLRRSRSVRVGRR